MTRGFGELVLVAFLDLHVKYTYTLPLDYKFMGGGISNLPIEFMRYAVVLFYWWVMRLFVFFCRNFEGIGDFETAKLSKLQVLGTEVNCHIEALLLQHLLSLDSPSNLNSHRSNTS